MGAARGMFDEAKHPRGFHGRFGSGGGVVRRTSIGRADNGLDRTVPMPTLKPSLAERARKLKIKRETMVPRGKLTPESFAEEEMLNWQSPRKRAEQMAKTGNKRRPRLGPEGALHAQRQAAGGFGRSNAVGTDGTYLAFGKRIRSQSPAGKRGAKLTSRGRYNLAKYG